MSLQAWSGLMRSLTWRSRILCGSKCGISLCQWVTSHFSGVNNTPPLPPSPSPLLPNSRGNGNSEQRCLEPVRMLSFIQFEMVEGYRVSTNNIVNSFESLAEESQSPTRLMVALAISNSAPLYPFIESRGIIFVLLISIYKK